MLIASVLSKCTRALRTPSVHRYFQNHAVSSIQVRNDGSVRQLSTNGFNNNKNDDISSSIDTRMDDNEAKRTVRDAYTMSVRQFQQQEISEPDWSAAHLLASALNLPWSNGFSQIQQQAANNNNRNLLLEQVLTKNEWDTYQSMVQRRLQDEPLQYILGKWDFLNYEQIVIRPPLLCPRPETEELVELVRNDLKQKQQQSSPLRLLEIGAGTGVIGISLADMIPSATVIAMDIEPVAVQTSLENAKLILGSRFHKRYSVVECSAQDYTIASEGSTAKANEQKQQFDLVVSNPPYIPEPDMSTLSRDVVEYESDQALCGGKDGMDVIRVIVQKWATEWGKKHDSVCWMEVDPTHPGLLHTWLEQRQELGVFVDSVHKDLSGRDRFVKLAFRKQ